MIGRRTLPEKYRDFNARWGVPFGTSHASEVPLQRRLDDPRAEFGPFAFQIAGGTRAFEYPWIYHSLDAWPGCRVLDIGGCVGGLQYVLALEGCRVTNVDPFVEGAGGFPASAARVTISPAVHERLNRLFSTDVRLVTTRLQDADLPPASFDRVVCASVLEHLPQAEAEDLVAHAARLLVPGGQMLLTVDLFLDLVPFGVLRRNFFGSNIDVCALVAASGLDLVSGDRSELHGFPEFDRDRIVASLDDLLVSYRDPVVSQALVLRKAPEPGRDAGA